MKTLALILTVFVTSTSFAQSSTCAVGLKSHGESPAQAELIGAIAKQLFEAGCTIGDAGPDASTWSSVVFPSPACSSDMVETIQYGCVTATIACKIGSTLGVLYNNVCVEVKAQ